MNGKNSGLINRQRQAGMTTIGIVFLLAFVGIFAFGFLRLTPVYLNYMKIVGVVDGVQKEFDGQGPTSSGVKRSIRRRFDVESVGVIMAKDVKVTTVDGGLEVSAVYEHTAPFIANIYFTVRFDKTVIIRR
jgi:hypothetical protein